MPVDENDYKETDNYQLPYPGQNAPIDTAQDFQNLAEKVDEELDTKQQTGNYAEHVHPNVDPSKIWGSSGAGKLVVHYAKNDTTMPAGGISHQGSHGVSIHVGGTRKPDSSEWQNVVQGPGDGSNDLVGSATINAYPSGVVTIGTSANGAPVDRLKVYDTYTEIHGVRHYVGTGRPDTSPGLEGAIGSTYTSTTAPSVSNGNRGALRWSKVGTSNTTGWVCVEGTWGAHVTTRSGWGTAMSARNAKEVHITAVFARPYGTSNGGDIPLSSLTVPRVINQYQYSSSGHNYSGSLVAWAATVAVVPNKIYQAYNGSLDGKTQSMGSGAHGIANNMQWPTTAPTSARQALDQVQADMATVESRGSDSDKFLIHEDENGSIVYQDDREVFLRACALQIETLTEAVKQEEQAAELEQDNE